MSDFDDEPIEGADANDIDGGATAAAAEPANKAKAKAKPPVDDDWDDDWDEEDDERGPKRDLTLVYAIVAAAIVIVLAVVLTRPKDDTSTNDASGNAAATTAATLPSKNWQSGVGDAVGENGVDAQERAESAPGVYIWTDFQGWHLRNNGTAEVNVTVAADQIRVKKTDDYNDDDEDGGAAFTTESTITLPAGDGSEGIGLDLGNSEQVTFTVTIDGKPVEATEIKLGGADATATANPVVIIKS